jgi:hypothetical protein
MKEEKALKLYIVINKKYILVLYPEHFFLALLILDIRTANLES